MSFTLDYNPQLEYEIGIGVSSLDGSVRGSALEWTGDPVQSQSTVVNSNIHFATTQEDFSSALGITSEVKGSYGLAHTSIKAEFARQCTTSKYSAWVVIRVNVSSVVQELAPHNAVKLKQTALDKIMKGEPNLPFFQSYGDYYVAGFEKGGEFIAVLEVISGSEQEQQRVKVEWEAGGVVGKLDVSSSGSASSETKRMMQKHDMNFHYTTIGPTVSGDDLYVEGNRLDPDKLLHAALHYSGKVTPDNAARITVLLQDYRPLLASGVKLSWPDLDQTRHTLARIGNWLVTLQINKFLIDGILSHPERYQGTASELRRKYTVIGTRIKNAITHLESIADSCACDFASGDDPEAPVSPTPPQDYVDSVDIPSNEPGIAYYMQSRTGYALGYDPNQGNLLVLQTLDKTAIGQRWLRREVDGGYQFVNGALKLFVGFDVPTSLHPLFPLIQINLQGCHTRLFNSPQKTPAGPNTTWTIAGDDRNNCAIRPQMNANQNLNAFGDSYREGTPIGLWDWAGGAPNETWAFVPVED